MFEPLFKSTIWKEAPSNFRSGIEERLNSVGVSFVYDTPHVCAHADNANFSIFLYPFQVSDSVDTSAFHDAEQGTPLPVSLSSWGRIAPGR